MKTRKIKNKFGAFALSFILLNFSPENKRSEFNWGVFVIDLDKEF